MKKFLETHEKLKKALDKVDTLCPNIENDMFIRYNVGVYVGDTNICSFNGCKFYNTSNTFRATKDKFGRIVWEEVND